MAQSTNGAPSRASVHGALTVTNKGVSVIPTFTLGKPAAIADLVVAKGRASFEPQFRMGLDGKPWSFIFWGRYKLVDRARFQLAVGAHPSIVFRTASVTINGEAREVIAGRRYVATELAPTVVLSRHASVGVYHLFSRALETDVPRYINYVAARSAITSIPLGSHVVARLDPQVFFLKVAERTGTYVNAAVTLAWRGSPLALQASENRTLETRIAGERVIWNVSAMYQFR